MRSIKKILGLDHLPSNTRDRRFAYYIINELGNNEGSGEIALSELPKLMKEKNIKVIAIDNIFELYPDPRDIINFMKKYNVKIVQVTGGFRNQRKLAYLAKKYGLSASSKLSPQKAAEISAKLALMNIGSEVNIFEDITRVIISRSRVLGEGGQHQVKYARSIASLILQEKKKIEEKLRKIGLSYDVFIREGDKGLKGAKFLIYAPYNVVRRYIKEYKGDLYQVRVMPLTREKIAFTKQTVRDSPNRMLICGIDPGDNTGLALIDLSGRILLVESKKEWSLFDVINKIYEYGNPVIIATDVPKTPQTIERIARKTGSIIYAPSRTLSVSEKHEIIRQLNYNVKNTHERDALVAAYLAYKKYKNLFDKIDNIISYIPLDLNPDLVKKDVINGISIRDAISKQINLAIERIIERVRHTETRVNDNDKEIQRLKDERNSLLKKLSETYERFRELDEQYKKLEKENQALSKKLEESQYAIYRLKNKLKKYEKDLDNIKNKINGNGSKIDTDEKERQIEQLRKVLKKKEEEIKMLRFELNKYKILVQKRPLDIPVKIIQKLTRESIEYTDKTLGISPGDIVYIVDPSGSGKKAARMLIHKGIQGVIISGGKLPDPALEEFREAGVPVINYEEIQDNLVRATNEEEIYFINKRILQKILEFNKKEEETKIYEKTENDVERIINIYREKRQKILKQY